MASISRNVLANAAGQLAGILTSLAVVPVYARLLGTEGFGVVGFVASLQAMAAMFDLGFSATANREVSRSSVGAGSSLAAVVRTLEWVYCATGGAVLLLLLTASSWLATHWIVAQTLPAKTLEHAIAFASVTVAFRFAQVLYHGVFRGLEQQTFLNVFVSLSAVAQSVVLVLLLVAMKPGLEFFIGSQATLAVAEFLVLRGLAWRRLVQVDKGAPRFRRDILAGLWRYALSVNIVTVLATGIKQVDKLIVSRLLPIQYSGYYAAATLVGIGIGKTGVPLQVATFPRFSKLVAMADWQALSRLTRQSVRLTALLAAALGCGVAYFAWDLLLVWTGSREIADGGAPALTLVAMAMVFNSIMGVAFGLILAVGATSISLWMNASGLVFLIPATYFLVNARGLQGAAMSWLLFNVVYYLAVPWFIARRIPDFSLTKFYFADSAPYILLAAAVFWVVRHATSAMAPQESLLAAIGAGIGLLLVAILADRQMRAQALGLVGRLRPNRG